MKDPDDAFTGSDKKSDISPYPQSRLFILLVAGIFLAEVLAMIVIYFVHPRQYWVETVLDASIMTLLIFPVLYFFHFRPLFTQIAERNRSEALLDKVLEYLPVGVWIVDKNGMILRGNQASLKIWSGAKYVGIDRYGEYKAWKLDTGQLVGAEEWGATRSIRSGETVLEEELEIECFDGSHKIIINSSTPIYDQNGIQGAIVVNRDITERKRTEQALAKNEALFKTAFQILPVGAWITDEKGNIIFGNPAGQAIWAGAKYIGIEQFGEYKAWWLNTGEPVTPDDWAAARAVRNGETSLNEELEIECFDGTHKIILNSAIPVRDERGKINGVFVVNQDITERKRFEQALIYSNELIQKAFDSIDILVAYMDRDFNFIQVNEAYARAVGQSPDFFIGKNHFELYPHPENQVIFQQVVETGEPYSVSEKPFEYPEFPERGVTYWNWRLHPILGPDGCVQNVVLSLLDVTARKKSELLLERQNQELTNLSIAENKQRQLAEGLVQSMLALNASLEIQEVLDTILEQVRHTFPFEKANILLIENNHLRVVRQFSLTGNPEETDESVKQYKLDDFPFVKRISLTHEPVILEGKTSASQEQSIPGMKWLRTGTAVPMVVGERVTGVINLTSDQPGTFNRETTRRLQAFAVPAALALENARLFAAEMKARLLAETVNVVSQGFAQTLDFDRMMVTLLENVCNLVPSERAYIVILKDEENLTLQASRGCGKEPTGTSSSEVSPEKSDKPHLLEVISSRKSILIPDVRQYPGKQMAVAGDTMHSWLGVPIIVGDGAIGVLAQATSQSDYFTSEHLLLSEVIVAKAAIAIQNAWLFDQVRAGRERLQSLSRRLLEVQENERRYIARELHDVASQTLTALKFGLRHLEEEVHKPENFLSSIAELKKMADQVLEELHRLAIGLRPASLDYLGLADALDQLVTNIGEHYNLSVHFKANRFPKDERLPDIVETNIYRIVQEALTNSVRHAHAKSIDVILETRNGCVVVIIEDDGISFDTTNVPKSGHLGLLGMQERAQTVSGTLQIESIKGRGTTIVLEIPYGNSNSNR